MTSLFGVGEKAAYLYYLYEGVERDQIESNRAPVIVSLGLGLISSHCVSNLRSHYLPLKGISIFSRP